MKLTDIIIKPRLTEKAYIEIASNTYVFDVNRNASKDLIKHAIEELFGVNVMNVRTISIRGKRKARGATRRKFVRVGRGKKAIVTLQEGQTIKIFDEIYKSDEK